MIVRMEKVTKETKSTGGTNGDCGFNKLVIDAFT